MFTFDLISLTNNDFGEVIVNNKHKTMLKFKLSENGVFMLKRITNV